MFKKIKPHARVVAVVGGGWGDEGKGKVSSQYSQYADLVIRATGGDNAGHTVYFGDKKIALHLVPGGIGYPQTHCLIGQGVVLNIETLLDEIQTLQDVGVTDIGERLKISGTASVLMPYHKTLDGLHELMKENKIGTTGKGIGPAYADKINRVGLKVYDLLLPKDELARKIQNAVKAHRILFEHFGMADAIDVEELAEKFYEYGRVLSNVIVNGHEYVKKFLYDDQKTIVIEGAQAVRLSIEVGDYPNVTSSDSNTLGTLSGAHLSHKDVTEVVNIYKAYFSRVGNGPFPTEFPSHIRSDGSLEPHNPHEGKIGDRLREFAGEYGATTHRPRRVGPFDAVLAKHSAEVSGADTLCINHMDTLGLFGKKEGCVSICTGYKYQGKVIHYYPDNINLTYEIPTPVYTIIEGGWEITKDMKTYDDLPEKAKLFINIIEQEVGLPVKYIGTGPKNEDIIVRDDV